MIIIIIIVIVNLKKIVQMEVYVWFEKRSVSSYYFTKENVKDRNKLILEFRRLDRS